MRRSKKKKKKQKCGGNGNVQKKKNIVMSFFENNSHFFGGPSSKDGGGGGLYGDAALSFNDKRNRNPNWTDHEIVRLLEILQEEQTIRDLMSQRNKQVFQYVAQRMCKEGADKTWDQCRIKLKNLKSQYRFVRDRFPDIDELDLENDEVVKDLIAKCQGRGISPSSVKHLRFLKRFLKRCEGHPPITMSSSSSMAHNASMAASTSSSSGAPSASGSSANTTELRDDVGLKNVVIQRAIVIPPKMNSGLERNYSSHPEDSTQDEESVSPPTTPMPLSNIRIISPGHQQRLNHKHKLSASGKGPTPKRLRREVVEVVTAATANCSSGSSNNGLMDMEWMSEGHQFIEKFNREMMDRFLEFQRRSQGSFLRWEQERIRQEHLAAERWRQEAREHEKQLFGMFCHAMAQCNAALTSMLRKSVMATRPNRTSGGGNKATVKANKRLPLTPPEIIINDDEDEEEDDMDDEEDAAAADLDDDDEDRDHEDEDDDDEGSFMIDESHQEQSHSRQNRSASMDRTTRRSSTDPHHPDAAEQQQQQQQRSST